MRADVAIVGAGAAGLMTAITAARAAPGLAIVLLEGQARPGVKILVSGGGRCNVTNRVVRPSDFHGDRALVARVLRRFDENATVAFFEALGVPLKHEARFDKLFPQSDSARTVLDALLAECSRLGVRLESGFRVDRIERTATGFEISAGERTIAADRLVLATGGRSLPRSGSDGTGYRLAEALGHTVTETAPALVPLRLDPHVFAGLEGLAVEAELSAWDTGRRTATESGPVLVTHFGVSGPAPMNVSRHFAVGALAGSPPQIRMNVFPGRTAAEVESAWLDAARTDGARPASTLLCELPSRFAKRLLEHAGVASETRLSELSRNARRRLLDAATNLLLPVADTRGWNAAEVTAGGIPLDEVDVRTMQSRRCAGLHLVGEILDVDGRIGGFNFQWAWASGHVAGEALVPRPAASR
jgi:predicted Rossmann fold flavoprotein